MKAILVVDVPQEDIGKLASIVYLGHDKYLRSIEFIPIQPVPSKRKSIVEWLHKDTQTYESTSTMWTHEITDYDKGWNDCVEFLEGDKND